MKKIIILCVATFCATGIFATPSTPITPDASAKILKIFHTSFPEVNNQSIYNLGDMYMVYFNNEETNSSCRIYYGPGGKVLETVRYYTGEQLSPFIRAKIDSKFKGKNIFMVTDVTNDHEHYYQVILQDAKTMIVIHANDNGTMYRERKYKRAG